MWNSAASKAGVGKSQMWGNWFLDLDWVVLLMLLAWRSYTLPSNSLGDCSSQPNGNKAWWEGGEQGDPPPPPTPEGLSQACAINFLTIYSQVEFIFPEETHMWCVSEFRLRGWGRRSGLWSWSIRVATNSVFLGNVMVSLRWRLFL